MPSRPFLIGVAGGSSSGKTTISERLVELTGETQVSRIELDSYYLDRSDEPPEQRRAIDYDHPDAFDWTLLNDHLAALANGASVPVPIYDYAADNRSGEVRIVEPTTHRPTNEPSGNNAERDLRPAGSEDAEGGSRKHAEQQVEQGFPFLPAGCHMELSRKAREIVLHNIRQAVPSRWAAKAEELRALAADLCGGRNQWLGL